jgi:hypothetical protein
MLKKSWDGLKIFWIERFQLSAKIPESRATGKLEKGGKKFVAGSHSHFFSHHIALYVLFAKKHVGAASCRDKQAF